MGAAPENDGLIVAEIVAGSGLFTARTTKANRWRSCFHDLEKLAKYGRVKRSDDVPSRWYHRVAKSDWVNGEFLDGPKTADWLERWVQTRHASRPLGCRATVSNTGDVAMGNLLGQSTIRAMYRWRHEGETPNIHTLDEILTKLGDHISVLPDSLFLPWPPLTKKYKKATPRERANALSQIESGMSIKAAAREIGVHYRTVSGWATKAKQAK